MSAFHFIDPQRIARESFARFVECFDELPSTNDLALRMAPDARTLTPRLLIARRQTAGRGRGANLWWSAPGALTFSLILDVDDIRLSRSQWPCVALTAALSICEAVQTLVPGADVGLKWPNDVWLNERKIAGILVEIPQCRPPVPARLVVGVGWNVNNSFDDAPIKIQAVGTSLCDALSESFDPTTVLLNWLTRFMFNLVELAQRPTDLAARWRQLCVLRSRIVTVASGDEIVSGRCGGIEDDGSLIIETVDGAQRCYAGVVRSID